MAKHQISIVCSFVLYLCSLLIAGCASNSRVAMEQATVMLRDVFTCKGLTEDKRWVGVTDVFMPEEDSRVVVVAQFAPEDLDMFVTYELTTPYDTIAVSETINYPKQNPLGIFFDLERLVNLGGEGEWRATVYANHWPIGEQIFYIGEKPEMLDEAKQQFFVIGEDESSPLSEATMTTDENRYSNYIQEVTPELSIPQTEDTSLSDTDPDVDQYIP